MTKVRILSGNLAGQIVEQTPGEAEMSISTGFAEAVKDDESKPEPAEPEAPTPTPKPTEVEPETISVQPAHHPAPARTIVPVVVPPGAKPTKAQPKVPQPARAKAGKPTTGHK